MSSYFNPYSDQDFFGFFAVLFSRLGGFLFGNLSWENLVADEIQIIVLVGIAISSALVGSFLVLRKMTMLANALSHTILLGIVVAYLLMRSCFYADDPGQILSVSVLMGAVFLSGVATTFLTQFLHRVMKLQEDASVGLVFSILFALGIILVTFFSKNVHIGVELVMGNVDALQREDIRLIFTVVGMNLLIFIFLFHGFTITTFDSHLARTLGFSPSLFNYLLMIQTAATAIAAFRAVGVLMVLAFIVVPILTARLLTHTLPKLIGIAVGIGVTASIMGVALSRHCLTFFGVGLSTGGIVVTILGLFYILAILFFPQRGLALRFSPKKLS